MAELPTVDDHGLEVLRKAGLISDDTYLTRYSIRTDGETRINGLRTGGVITEITLDDTSWTAFPTTALTDRNAIAIQNRSGDEIKINYDNTEAGYVGMVISNGGERQYDITDAIIIYGKAEPGATPTIFVEELA